MTKNAATWIGIVIAILGIVGTGLNSAASYGRLEGRVAAVEEKQRTDMERITRAVEKLADGQVEQGRKLARICGALPGCQE